MTWKGSSSSCNFNTYCDCGSPPFYAIDKLTLSINPGNNNIEGYGVGSPRQQNGSAYKIDNSKGTILLVSFKEIDHGVPGRTYCKSLTALMVDITYSLDPSFFFYPHALKKGYNNQLFMIGTIS